MTGDAGLVSAADPLLWRRIMTCRQRALVLCLVFVAAPVFGSGVQTTKPPVNGPDIVIHNGFLTGSQYRSLDANERRFYAAGLVDGMFLAPFYGAPKDRLLSVEACVTGMTTVQVSAILSKQLDDHPESWHESANTVLYGALIERCPK
jgi:hypothetical protein